MNTFCKEELAWNEYQRKSSERNNEPYIEVPYGVNPYDYTASCGLAQIFKFGYKQAKRGCPYEPLGSKSTLDAEKAFKLGWEAGFGNNTHP